jgi:hypothetical protein
MAAENKHIDGDMQMICRDMKEVRKDLYGNGNKGIKIEVAEMKQNFNNHKEMITAKLKTNNAMTLAVLLALVGNLIKSFF